VLLPAALSPVSHTVPPRCRKQFCTMHPRHRAVNIYNQLRNKAGHRPSWCVAPSETVHDLQQQPPLPLQRWRQ
jgi:hypothetical protein